MWKLILVLVFCASTASAGVDEQFPEGALGLSWGSTLQQVQAAYPGGLAWPVSGDDHEGVAYVIPGKPRMLGFSTPVSLVQFLFTKKNRLRTIFLHFSYSDREAALYDVGELLGHDYSVKDEATARIFRWKSEKATAGQFEIGASALYPWAHLGLQVRDISRAARQ